MKDTLCNTCSVPIDYTQGWIYCSYRGKWLYKGYKNCRGYNKAPHQIKHPSGHIELVESFTRPLQVSSQSRQSTEKETHE